MFCIEKDQAVLIKDFNINDNTSRHKRRANIKGLLKPAEGLGEDNYTIKARCGLEYKIEVIDSMKEALKFYSWEVVLVSGVIDSFNQTIKVSSVIPTRPKTMKLYDDNFDDYFELDSYINPGMYKVRTG